MLPLAVAFMLALAGSAQAAPPPPVLLGTADSFAVLAGSAVTNTGSTVVNGDLGVSPSSTCSGFASPCTGGGPGIVNGTIHAGDFVAAQAKDDLKAAYNDAAGRACNTNLTGQNLGGLTLTTGVYCFSSSAQLTGTLTLDAQGNPDAVFIFQIGSMLTTAPSSSVSLINGARACNVFWQVGSSATLDTNTAFVGNILASASITANTGATVDGRLLARGGAVTLDANTVSRARCARGSSNGDVKPPHLEINGGPNGGFTGSPNPCTNRNFKIRIKVRDASGIDHTDVFLDGKRIKRSTRKSFSVLIKAAKLRSGRHTIKVVALDNAGNRTVKRRRFTRCNRPMFPDFTG